MRYNPYWEDRILESVIIIRGGGEQEVLFPSVRIKISLELENFNYVCLRIRF